jgi:hypothetical protein
MAKKKVARKKATVKSGKAKVKMGRHFAKISRAPLKRQKSSDAWNERDNKIVAARTGAKLMVKGTIEINKAKKRAKKKKRAPIKKRKPYGSRSSK